MSDYITVNDFSKEENKNYYTADDETPSCTKCNHFGDDSFNCDKYCGASKGWYGYIRGV